MNVVKRVSKGYFYSFLADSFFRSIRPYVTIIYTYLILDGLIDKIPQSQLLTYVFWMVGLNVVLEIILKILNYSKAKYLIELDFNLENQIAIKTYELDFCQIEDSSNMKLIQQAKEGSNGNGGLRLYCEYVMTGMIAAVLSIVYGVILLSGMLKKVTLANTTGIAQFLNSPYSLIIIFVSMLIPGIISWFMMKLDNKKSYDVMMGNIEGNRRFSYYFRIASDYKYGKDIRIFGIKDMILNEMKDKKNSVDANWRGYVNFAVMIMSVTFFGNMLLSFIAYAMVGLKAIYGIITIGSVVSYVASITLISKSVGDFLSRYARMHLFNDYLDNYFTYLNLDTKQVYGDVEYVEPKHLEITFDNVSFKYPNVDEYALKNLNFTISNYEKVAIVGPNGAGKTTLVKLLCRLYDASEGEIKINNIPIQNYSKEALYRLYSIVFQDFNLFSYSIEDNIAIGNEIDRDKLDKVIDQVGLSKRIKEMKDGTKTILFQRNKEAGIEVSGGEAQKLAIARALYKESPFVILDEPTAALDPRSEAEIYDKFNLLVNNKTSIFISHRMSSTKFCDRILVLNNGEIAEIGNHESLVKQNGLYNQMWTAQAKYYQK